MNSLNTYFKAFLITCVAILAIIFSARAEVTPGKITGTITTADGKSAAYVSVALKEINRGTTTNEDGVYTISNIKPGNYTLRITLVGSKNEEKTVSVTAGKTTVVDFTLLEKASQLNEVIISAGKTLNNTPVSLNKARINPLDLPQSAGVVNSKVIADQQINHLGDAVRNVSGVSLTQTRGGVGETFSARGYSIGITGSSGSIFKDGVLSNTAGFPEASTLESVEILKGSSALLYGNVSGGLIINMVTKKPRFESGGEASLRYGSYNMYKPTVDVYGPISNKVAFRVISTYENDESYRSQVKTERTYVNPSLLYNIDPNTSLLVEGDYLKANLTPDFGIGTLNNGTQIPVVPRSQYINTAWAYSHMNQFSGVATLNHRFTDAWNLNFITSAQGTGINSYGASLPNVVSATGDWTRSLARANTTENDYTAQANLNGRFKTGTLNHQLLFGTDATEVLNISNGYLYNGQTAAVYIYDKINTINLNKYSARTDMPDAQNITRTTAPVYRYGVYLQELVGLSTKFKILAGLRYTFQQTSHTSIDSLLKAKTVTGASAKSDKAFSPKIALIYQPVNTTSVYASYSNNFLVNTGTDIYTGQGLKPSIVNQYEAGVKNEFLNGRLSANFSIYRIINNDLAVVAPFLADGVTLNTDNTRKQFNGQTTSDGLEVDVNGNLSKNLYFIVGYGYNFMRYTKTSGLKGSSIEGEQIVINPRNTANASLFYTFHNFRLRGVKVGASAFYTGSRLGGYNNTVGQTQAYSRLLPIGGFATLDLTAGYTYQKISLLASITNVTNTLNYLIHDNYSITPIPPRQLLTTLAYRF